MTIKKDEPMDNVLSISDDTQNGNWSRSMQQGLWVTFEGPDGVGKSTMMNEVQKIIRRLMPDVKLISTSHPGSTKLGKHLRDLVKTPEKYDVNVGPLASQLLMYADYSQFRDTILIPGLNEGAIILADRCNLISGLVYGRATGLSITTLSALTSLVAGPKIDLLYLLHCKETTQNKRLSDRKLDRFEANDVRTKVNDIYSTMLTGAPEYTVILNKIIALEKVRYISTDGPMKETAEKVATDIMSNYIQMLEEQ